MQRIQALCLLHQKTDQSAIHLKAAYVSEVCDCFGNLRTEFRPEPNPLERTNLSMELRGVLRDGAFADWCKLPLQRGVEMFQHCPQANRWIAKKESVTEGGWRIGLMARCRAVPVRTLPSLCIFADEQLCRHCGRRPEKMGHVLGECEHNNLPINKRHNEVVQIIAKALREKKFHVDVEVRCQATDGTSRRTDLLVIWPDRQKAVILDPTIRLERSDDDAEAAFAEKQNIYTSTAPWFEREYTLPPGSIAVYGL